MNSPQLVRMLTMPNKRKYDIKSSPSLKVEEGNILNVIRSIGGLSLLCSKDSCDSAGTATSLGEALHCDRCVVRSLASRPFYLPRMTSRPSPGIPQLITRSRNFRCLHTISSYLSLLFLAFIFV